MKKATPRRRNRYLWPSLILLLAATLLPGNGKIAGDYLDKVVHFALFFFLMINICYAFGKEVWRFLVACLLLGLLTEYLQQYIPGRNMDYWDALADGLGVLVAFWGYVWLEERVNAFFVWIGA